MRVFHLLGQKFLPYVNWKDLQGQGLSSADLFVNFIGALLGSKSKILFNRGDTWEISVFRNKIDIILQLTCAITDMV